MKISNETKIGALTAIAITLLILGFNFLKGKDLFSHSAKIYAVFKNVEGLELSNPVTLKGLQIGTIYAIEPNDKNVDGVKVTINLKKNVNIPKNSLAYVSTGLITSATIGIAKGDARDYLADGDIIATEEKPGLLSQVQTSLNPVLAKLSGTLQSLDSLVEAVGTMFDPKTKNNFAAIFANLSASSASLQTLLNTQTGALAHALKNVDTFTGNLAHNNDQINKTLDNLQKTTNQLSNARIQETLESLHSTVEELKNTMGKINNGSGSLGMLINDKKLYQNLESTSRSLNILLDDLRVHPKRYVNISVFGRKDKSGPLTAPLNDSSSKSSSH